MKRKDNEDFEDYRNRRHNENKKTKAYLKGRPVWDNKYEGYSYRRDKMKTDRVK